MQVTRRDAILAVTTASGVLTGVSGLMAQSREPYYRLLLDGTSGILVQYQGQQVQVTPREIMAALTGK